jgi:Ca2+-binding EF-hand superfamily protein
VSWISYLHRQKYRKLFERLDADNSGTIEETDIDALVQFWCNIFKVQPGSTKWQWINDSAHKMWRYLLEYIDADGNQQVNHDEWEAAVEQPNFIDNVGIPHAILHFDIWDTDTDGRLSQDEFIAGQRNNYSGLSDTESHEMFQRLDADVDGYIMQEEYTKAIEEFYKSG